MHDDIEFILVDFYKELFSKDSLDMQIQTKIINDLDLSLSDLEREQCEGLFTKDELCAALKGLQTGKSPGSDGLPAEFYCLLRFTMRSSPLCSKRLFSSWLTLHESARSSLTSYP